MYILFREGWDQYSGIFLQKCMVYGTPDGKTIGQYKNKIIE